MKRIESKDADLFVLRRYPHLAKDLPMRCLLCGMALRIAEQILEGRFVGIKSERCTSCNRGPVTRVTYTNAEEGRRMADTIRAIERKLR